MFKFLKLYFLPHPDNNHKAYLIQPGFIGVLIAVYLLNQSFIKSFTILRPGVLGYSSEITVQKVIDQTNLLRKEAGLPRLVYNPILSQSAASKAADMFAANYWAHNSPSGRTPWDFFKAAGYKYSLAGENLAKDFYDTDSMMKAWMNSPTHRDNIVNSKYKEIGIGVVNGVLGGVKTTLVVQHFGTPQSGVVYSATTQEPEIVSPVNDVAPSSRPLVSPLAISQIVGLLMFGLIIITLIIDIYHSLQFKHHRLSGSSLSHAGFLLVILMLLIFTRQGSILF
ncbi:MAG: CAP domain-containing protein [Microgenomates group bacterium]